MKAATRQAMAMNAAKKNMKANKEKRKVNTYNGYTYRWTVTRNLDDILVECWLKSQKAMFHNKDKKDKGGPSNLHVWMPH